MIGSYESAHSFTIDGHQIAAKPLKPGLYVVATPIGNLGDTTLRALATLGAADVVACEDTRVTGVLLHRFSIRAKLVAYHDHNAAKQRPKLIAMLNEGKAVALVSDAGTPLVSDPGYRLVVDAQAAGHVVIPIPGPSAVLAALVASGLPTDSFFFVGFLPPKSVARLKRLAELAMVPTTLVFFESAPRLAASLADMKKALGSNRAAAVARELTKAFETVRRGTLAELAEALAGEPPPKGEIVVVVAPPTEVTTTSEDVDRILLALLEEKSVSAAAAEAAAITGLSRRDLYQRALTLKDGKNAKR